ncbi:DUF2793 domain-containing protein [Paracoccus sp. p4-l81]|uniref:DUF2793 domain-containing protein n=1 Tax=unclassified Paracoccus (in: a-proteobacteria) TaxID=2688777 RepID=UPI0035BADC18
MSETSRLNLPLLMPAQAQKHVTVNEALSRLDAAVNLVLVTLDLTTPPEAVAEGLAYGVPSGAVNDWAGHEGQIAVGQNGGWIFLTPRAGWRAQIADRGVGAIHDGLGWQVGALSLSPHGAGLLCGVAEHLHELMPGTENSTAWALPGPAMIVGVTARVVTSITGTLTGWSLGMPGAPARFGQGLGKDGGSWCRGLLGAPTTFWSPEPLVLTAEGGAFSGGSVRIAVHYLELALPRD